MNVHTDVHVSGVRPVKNRSPNAAEPVRFAVGECSLGAVAIAITDRGIRAILLGDDPGVVTQNLRARFPAAQPVGGDGEELARVMAQVIGAVEVPANGFELPLDARGTPFQQRVWQALREIPAGETASYAEVARRIGEPKSARAVARACAANPLAVVVPCHRVVRSDGGLSGYRWGIERKRTLLQREAAV